MLRRVPLPLVISTAEVLLCRGSAVEVVIGAAAPIHAGHRGVVASRSRSQRSRIRPPPEGAGPVREGGRQLDRPTPLTNSTYAHPCKAQLRRMAHFPRLFPDFVFARRQRMAPRLYPTPCGVNVKRVFKPTADTTKAPESQEGLKRAIAGNQRPRGYALNLNFHKVYVNQEEIYPKLRLKFRQPNQQLKFSLFFFHIHFNYSKSLNSFLH